MRLVQRCDAAFIPFDAFLRFVSICMVLRHRSNNLLITSDYNELTQDDQHEDRDYDFAFHFDSITGWSFLVFRNDCRDHLDVLRARTSGSPEVRFEAV